MEPLTLWDKLLGGMGQAFDAGTDIFDKVLTYAETNVLIQVLFGAGLLFLGFKIVKSVIKLVKSFFH